MNNSTTADHSRVDDPMAYTFSSISPKHQSSAQAEQKKFFLKLANTG